MPSRARLDEFIAVVEAGDHAGAIERYYTEDSSMQENAAPPRVGRDLLVAHERGVLARMTHVYFQRRCPPWWRGRQRRHSLDFELTDKSARCAVSTRSHCSKWRGDKIFRERFSTIRPGPKT